MQEISLNILDIVQNSITAGAKLIEINITEDKIKDELSVLISDNGCGMTEEQLKKVIDPFYTTRTTRKVGLGISLFKMAAELSGGSFKINSKIGIGTQVTAIFGLSHIDRMPLGDMSATICSLIRANPELDFNYSYRQDEKEINLKTSEMREVLGDVPLDNPDVIAWIKESLENNDE